MMTEPPISYKRQRFPPQIIAHAVWLYFRFPLSLRLVEELLLERGIASHPIGQQTARSWPRGTKEDLQHCDLLAKKIDWSLPENPKLHP